MRLFYSVNKHRFWIDNFNRLTLSLGILDCLARPAGSTVPYSNDKVKQEFSTVNSTQLVLENPDAYDEIQSRFNELLQQKGDLEKTLHAEAQKHREDLRMWEYEADCPGAAVEAE